MTRRGFTVGELLISLFLFSLMLTAGYRLFLMSNQVYRQVSGREDALLQLKKSARYLQKDLLGSNYAKCGVADVPASLAGGGKDGCAICMLSALVDGEGAVVTKDTGEPFWQRNILYYLVVPQGDTCAGGQDAQGYDDRCPHKVLIRKVLDKNSDTGAQVEDAVANLAPYLTRPNGYDVSAMRTETDVKQVDLVAINLLSMDVKLQPDPDCPGEVRISLKALNQVKGNRDLAVGTVSLGKNENTLEHLLSVFPRNNQ